MKKIDLTRMFCMTGMVDFSNINLHACVHQKIKNDTVEEILRTMRGFGSRPEHKGGPILRKTT